MSNNKANVFITFAGTAKEAINYYNDIFRDSEITNITEITDSKYGEGGKLLNGTIVINGLEILVLDLPKEYHPGNSSAFSLFITCQDSTEFFEYFDQLKVEGTVIMGPEEMMNYENVCWVTDKFGITWQLVNKK